MLTSSWLEALHQSLNCNPPNNREGAGRLAIIGVGNELCGDDAAGIVIVRALQERPIMVERERLCLIDAGQSPEAFTGVIRRFGPTHVLILDSADMGEPPGTIRWLSWQDVDGLGASTHTFPLSLFATYLMTEIKCNVVLLGIQPERTTFGAPLSSLIQASVQHVVDRLANELQTLFRQDDPAVTSRQLSL